jgi:hypothetical protein
MLAYLDGLKLYGPAEWESLPMPDLLHPDAAGQRHMGERFAALLPDVLGVMQSDHCGASVLRASS